MTGNRPEKAKVVERLLPTVNLRERKVIDREPDDDELVAMAERFVAAVDKKGEPKPDADVVVSRLRNVLRHVDEEHQELVLVSSPRPPYFGVTTAKGRAKEVKAK